MFRAPDLGLAGYVPAARVLEAAAAHGLGDIDAAGLDEVAVMRLGRTITVAEVEARLRAVIGERLRIADAADLSLTLDPLEPVRLDPAVRGELAVEQLDMPAREGRSTAVLRIADAPGFRLRIGGSAAETVAVVALTRAVERGAVLSDADLELRRVPRATAAQSLANLAEAQGLAARRSLRAGETLRAADLERPEVVARNQLVTIAYESPGLALTLRGRAVQGGAVGSTVSVLNLQSNRMLQATVAGPGRVVVAPAAPRLAAAAR